MTAHACPPVRLVNAGTLFTYLDPALTADGPLPATSNSIEGGRQRAAQGHAQGPQGALDRAQDQGRLLVVLHALAGPAACRGVPTTTGSAAATARTPARRGCGRRPSCCLPTPRATSTTSPPALPARSWPPISPNSGCPATRAGATRPTTLRARAFSEGSRSSSSTTGTGRAGRRSASSTSSQRTCSGVRALYGGGRRACVPDCHLPDREKARESGF